MKFTQFHGCDHYDGVTMGGYKRLTALRTLMVLYITTVDLPLMPSCYFRVCLFRSILSVHNCSALDIYYSEPKHVNIETVIGQTN